MTKPILESIEPVERITIEETCRPELDRMSSKEIATFRSMRDPLSRIVSKIHEDQDVIDGIFDRVARVKGEPKRRASELKHALHEIKGIINSDQSQELLRATLHDIEAKLSEVAMLRQKRLEVLREWESRLSDMEDLQGSLGAKVISTRQDARRGEVSATFELRGIEKELVSLGDTILNVVGPEIQTKQEQPTLTQEDLMKLETRLQGILIKIQSILAPTITSRHTGPLSKKNERWAEGAFRE